MAYKLEVKFKIIPESTTEEPIEFFVGTNMFEEADVTVLQAETVFNSCLTVLEIELGKRTGRLTYGERLIILGKMIEQVS